MFENEVQRDSAASAPVKVMQSWEHRIASKLASYNMGFVGAGSLLAGNFFP
jgi:hypothetical protein